VAKQRSATAVAATVTVIFITGATTHSAHRLDIHGDTETTGAHALDDCTGIL